MKHLLLILLLLTNCKLNNTLETHGVSNLKLKLNNLIINSSNKNDIQNIMGPPIIKDIIDKNTWTYYEIKKQVNLFGKKSIILNDVVVFKFDKLDILKTYITYDINDLKKIEFEKNETEAKSIDQSLIKSLLASTKKRLELNKTKPSEQ